MSATPGSRAPQPPSGTDTRLLLDELDVLMQKMLALPVNQPAEDEAPASKPPVRAADTPRVSPPEQPRAPHFIAGPLSYEVETPVEAALPQKSTNPFALERDTSSSGMTDAPAAMDELGDPFSSSTHRALVAEDGPIIVRSLPPVDAFVAAGTSGSALAPLAGINRLFDRGTRLLGPLGRWLRSTSGRRALGWLGLGLWLAAIVWGVLKWIG